jgi:hypothetical protein
MSTIWVMIIVATTIGLSGGVAIEKVGVYDTETACLSAGAAAGFTQDAGVMDKPRFYCVSSFDGMGFE